MYFTEPFSNCILSLVLSNRRKRSAPISKVIEYLPPNIPRILINRTVVHPSSTSTTSTNTDSEEGDGDGENQQEKLLFVRDNYVFDAYLLGFCDDVTRALAKQLFKNSNINNGRNKKSGKGDSKDGTKQESTVNPDCGGRLLSSLLERENNDSVTCDDTDNKDHGYDIEEWRESIAVPPERVLLFPGALAAANTEGSNTTGTDDEGGGGELTYREIAHCDGCSKRIRGTIQKCAMCFDYDLCSKCFPKLSKTHYDGTHKFNAELAAK